MRGDLKEESNAADVGGGLGGRGGGGGGGGCGCCGCDGDKDATGGVAREEGCCGAVADRAARVAAAAAAPWSSPQGSVRLVLCVRHMCVYVCVCEPSFQVHR